jgi:hypothetical protein
MHYFYVSTLRDTQGALEEKKTHLANFYPSCWGGDFGTDIAGLAGHKKSQTDNLAFYLMNNVRLLFVLFVPSFGSYDNRHS